MTYSATLMRGLEAHHMSDPAPVAPLIVYNLLEIADAALRNGDLITGRRHVAAALRRLEHVKASQDEVLKEWATTPEQPAASSVAL